MSKGNSDAPSPDPRIGESAMLSAKTGEQWLSFAKDAFKTSTARQEKVDATADAVIKQQMGIADTSIKRGNESYDRYKSKFQPIEDQFVAEAKDAGSKTLQDARASEAGADVSTAAAAAKETARREAAAVGITPGSGRYAGIERAGELGTTLSRAGAENNARAQERARGTTLRGAAIDLGNTTIGRSSANLQLGLGAGSSAYGIAGQNQQLSMMPAQNMNAGFGGQMQGYGQQGTMLTNVYGLQLDAWKAKQEANAANIGGIASAIGSFAGLAAMSDPKSKKNVKATKDGDGLKAVKKLKINKFDYKPGQGDGGKGHTGPMSDNFAKATGQRDTGQIKFQDAIGITMKAVQDLDKRVSQLDKSLSKGKPKARRSSQSPAKARPTAAKKTQMTTARPQVKAQAYGIRRG